MNRREPPWWAELILAALYAYTNWAMVNSGPAIGPSVWYNLHLIALGLRRGGIRFEQYAHRKYLESVMH